MSDQRNNLWDQLTPEIKTDHGKFNLADLAVIVLDIILLGYTCYRSWHVLDQTFSGNGSAPEFAILAILGLIGLDIGAVIWSLVWMFGSTTMWQDTTALIMFIVDGVGMVLTSMVDSVSGTGSQVPLLLQTGALYGVPAIILMNVIVGIVYHMQSPQTSLSRKTRQMEADMNRRDRLADLRQRENAMRLQHAMNEYKQNQALIEQQQMLARQKLELDSIQLGVSRALADQDAVRNKSGEISENLKRDAGLNSTTDSAQPPAAPNKTPGRLDQWRSLVNQVRAEKGGDANGNGQHADPADPAPKS